MLLLDWGGKMGLNVKRGKIKCEEMDGVLKMLVRECSLEKLVAVVLGIVREFEGREVEHFMIREKVPEKMMRRVFDKDKGMSIGWIITKGNASAFEFFHTRSLNDFSIEVIVRKATINPLTATAFERLFNHLEKCVKEI